MPATARPWERTMGMPGVLIFESRDDQGRMGRVYVRGDENGRARIVGHDLDDGVPFSRTKVERAIRQHLDSLVASGRAYEAEFCGIDPRAPLRTNRGPKPSPGDPLDELVENVLRRQESGQDLSGLNYSPRRIRELMAKAEDDGRGVRVERQPGRPNRYVRVDRTRSEEPSSVAPAVERDRARRFRMNAKRAELEAKRQRPPRVRQSRQLSEFAEGLAGEDDALCDWRHGSGLRCSLRAKHHGEHALLFDDSLETILTLKLR